MTRLEIRINRLLLVVASLFVVSWPSLAQGPCVNIFDDPGTQCFASDCFLLCASDMSLAQTAAPLIPGFFVKQDAGRLVVATVLPHTPAQEAGLKDGDEIVAVDGIELPLLGSQAYLWQQTQTHTLTVRRGEGEHSISFRPLRIGEFLARFVENQSGLLAAKSVRTPQGDGGLRPYISGVLVRPKQHLVEVMSVFPGTEAARAGIRQGDIILAVDGKVARIEQVGGLRFLEGGHFGASRTVLLQRGKSLVTAGFKLTAVTRFLRMTPSASADAVQLKAGL